MAEKKSWRDYTQTASTAKATSNEKTGSWRDYTSGETTSTTSSNTRGSWRGHSNINDVVSTAGKNVVDLVNNWLTGHNSYITSYKDRYSGRKYNYEDAYVSDSADWLNTVTQQKSNLDKEADSVLSYLDQFNGYLDEKWVNEVKKTISDARNSQGLIIDSSQKDHEWWSNFGNEDLVKQYGSAEDAYKYYQRDDSYRNKYSGQKYDDIQTALSMLEDGEEKDWLVYNQHNLYKGDDAYNSKAKSGWESFEAQKIAKQEAEDSKPWWQTAIESFANAPADTSLPGAGLSNATAAYRNDLSYREPNDKWSEEQKLHFGYLWGEDKKKAYLYAEQLNNQINVQEKYEKQQAVSEWASKNFGTGLASTIGAIASAPLGLADLLDDMTEYAGRGTITQKGELSPFEMGQAAQSGVANSLNEKYGSIDDDVFILGGKGLGDIYSLGVSAANSMLSAYTMGGTGTLINFIGQGGAAGVDDALSRGATPEQALLYGTIVGAAEGITEMIPADELLKIGSASTLKNYFKAALKQGIGESIEEGASSVIGNIADSIIMQDKSNLNAAIKEYMSEGMSEEEATAKAWKDMVGGIVFDAMGGFVTGSTNAMVVGGIQTGMNSNPSNQANIDAVKQYGDNTASLIQEGLQSDVKSDSYKLAQKYKAKTENGKAMTGAEIRNLLAANQEQITPKDMKLIQQAAEKRLTKLGQTTDVAKVAELATKYATGQKLSKAEKTFLASSQYGSRVANELLPSNIASEDYSTGWAEEIGTKQVNAAAYNKKTIRTLLDAMASAENPATYKSLEERVGEESSYKVSESGQATIRETGEAISLENVEVVNIGKGDISLKVDGKEVKASEIDFADESQSYLFDAVSKIENITPGAATAIIRDYNPTTGQTAGEYLNGIDEGYTYGYYGYSEADLQAGSFATKLTGEQMMSAYKLGQSARKISNTSKTEAVKRMRTAAEAEATTADGKAAPKAKNLTISYNQGGGKVVSIDKAGIKDAKRSGAVEVAKILHKMGLGTRVEFFSSYLSTDANGNEIRVFLDDNGVEQAAYSGVYMKSDGTIRIDLEAYNGRGLTLNALSHELTHFIQQWSVEKYQVLADFLIKSYEKTDMTMHERVLREQKRLENVRGDEVSYDEAFDEVVANAMSKMFDDGKLVEKLTELKAQDETLARKLWEGFKKILAKFIGIYEKESALFKDAADLVAMKETFEQLQNMFAEALVEASENLQATFTAAESQTITEAGIGFDEATKSVYSLHFSTAYKDTIQVGKKTFDKEAIAQLVAKGTGRSIEDARKWVQSELTIANIVMQNPEFLDFEADSRYEAIKKNSDYPQGTVDLSNLCPKREEFTAMFDRLQKKYPNKLFTAQDIADMRKILAKNDITVACGACFVEDRRQLVGEIAETFIGMWKEAVDSGKPLQKTNAAGQKSDLLVTKALAKQYGLTPGAKIMATDTYIPNQYDLTTYEGFKLLEKNHPTIAMGFNRYNNSRGQQSARLIEGRAEYNRQILGWSDAKVRSVNNNGGLRIFSFSDFEVVHLLDLVQVIIDCAAKGVKIQGYTKIPAFAKLVRGTGIKLNRSLIPKGDYGYHVENGKVVLDYDTIEGIDINDENFVDESNNPDVGNIVIGINPTQIGAAMLDPFIDYIIPFHSNKAKEILKKLGTGEWVNYKESQHEKDISTGTSSKHNVNIYTEVINKYHPKNKVEFVEAFLAECKRQGKIPRYAEFLNVDSNGDYAYREGYHKLLVDFKMFDAEGNILPQGNITPKLNDGFMAELLNAEVDRKKNYEFPQKVYDDIDKKFGEQYSSQETDLDSKEHPYSYDTLVSKPDMVVTEVDSNVPSNRADVVFQAKQNAAKLGKTDPKTGSVSVHVDDVGADVVLATNGLKHSLDRRLSVNAPVVLKAGEILQNSIRINEMTPKKQNATASYILIGAAKNENGETYIVRSVVDRFSNELTSMDVLYAINAKKEPAALLPRLTEKSAIRTDSTISIAKLLDLVNQYFPDVLPEDVLKHYGYDARPEGELGESALYSSHQTDLDSAGNQLSKEQAEYFKDSLVRDANGNLKIVYHGSGAEFTEFSYAFMSTHGSMEGQGFYFTDKKSMAEGYQKNGAKLMTGYLDIKKPLSDSEVTLKRTELTKLLKAIDPTGDDVVINYDPLGGVGYPSRAWYSRALAATVDAIYNSSDSDSEILADLANSGAGTEAVVKKAREVLGYDGYIVSGKYDAATVYVAFESNQFKNADNLTPTSNPDVRFSSHETDYSNRHLLANAFEGITQNSVEYKMLQDYKSHIKELNELEAKLSGLNAEIRKIRFGTTGARDTARLTQLENEAKQVAKEINRYDKRLLSLEASEPLRKVVDRERKKEAQKTKEYVREIQQNKKVRAEQTELRHKIRKAIRDLDKILNRGNKKLNVKEDLQPVVTKALQAAEILFTDNYGSYDMLRNGIGADMSDAEEALFKTCAQMLSNIDKMTADSYEGVLARQEAESRLRIKMSKLSEVFARERKRLNNTTVSSILGELADSYAKLNDSTMAYVQGAYSEPVYNFLKNLQSEVGGTIVKDMTKNQLEHVYAAYRMVLETVRNANKMFNAELKQSREQLGNAVIEEVINAGGVHLLGTKLGDTISQFDWNNLKPVWVGDRIGSETFGKLMNGLFKGQYNFAEDIDAVRRFKLEMDDKYKPRGWDAEKLYEFESSTGKKFSLNLQQIMSLYAFSKREQAYSHLLNGGFVFEENSTVIVEKNGIKRTYIHKGAASYKVNEATLNGIVNSLTVEQKAYVDDMQAYLSNVMGAKGNEVSMKLYGIEMFKEKFYFPLRSSGAYMEKAKEAEMKKQQGQINLVNSGFTHAVKPEAKNPIVLSGFMDVWAEHCNEMSMYHSMVLPMEDFRKVYNYTTVHDENMESASVYQTIQDAYGKAATSYIDQLYRELNAGATVDPRETPWKKLISNFKKSSVMLSASVWVQQFSSIGRAYAVIDPKHFIGAKVNSDTKLSAAEEMKKYAPVAIIKEMGGFDTGTKGNAKAYIMAEKYGKGERIQGLLKDEQYRGDLMGYLPAKADEKTWAAIWEAAKRETKANHPKMDVKSEEFLKLSGERFSEVIEKTQVYDSVLARSANMRSKGNFMSMATAFMAEPTTTVNLLENAIRSGNGKHIARAFGAVAVSIVLNNALASIVYAMRDDDEDETLLEKYFQSFTSGMIDDISPMSYYPFLKDVYSLFQGYDVERTDMSVIADVRDALKKAISLLGKDTSDMNDEELAAHYKQVNEVLMGVLDAGCSAFGVPVKNIRRDVNGLINAFTTAQNDLTDRDNSWLSFWDKVGSAVKDTIPIYAWTKDNAKTDKLYDAIVSGDKSYLARLKSTYKTDSAYQSAVRKALRENDSRIQEAAQAKYDGNTEAYKRIFKEIQKEGKFSFDDIMSAINTELSKLQPDKVTSDYTASGYVEAVAVGNTAEAKAMRDDIIATHMANGKTEAEAEEAFASAVATGIREAYSSGLLDEAGAKKMLLEYAGKDEEEAASKVSYWAFCEEHSEYKDVLTEANVAKYHEFAEPENISVDVYAQFITGTKGLADIKDEWGDVEVTKREQVLEVIDSLPLTWQQKDALYLAAGYSESKIWDVPW